MLADGLIAPRKLRTLKFDDALDAKLWGLSHLWFLHYLMTYVVLLAVGWQSLKNASEKSLRRIGLPICIAIAVVTLAYRPEVVWGFQHAFLPVPSKWLYSLVFFVAGAMWWRLDPQLQAMSTHSTRMVGPSLMFWIASVSIGLWWLTREGFSLNSSWISQISLSIITVAAAVGVTFTIIGCSIGNVRRLGPLTSRLAGASFLIYLLHHPVVGLAHITAKYASPDLPVALKIAGVTLLGVGAGVAVDYLWDCRCERALSRAAGSNVKVTLPFEKPQSNWEERDESASRAA